MKHPTIQTDLDVEGHYMHSDSGHVRAVTKIREEESGLGQLLPVAERLSRRHIAVNSSPPPFQNRSCRGFEGINCSSDRVSNFQIFQLSTPSCF
jgi:hypothetical protein